MMDLANRTDLSRNDWMSCVALILQHTFSWDKTESLSYADCMANNYYDDPEWTNEDGEVVSPREAIDADREYW